MSIAIQGIPGSFHHQVALNYFGKDEQIESYRTFDEVSKAVKSGQCRFGVMAIENSIAGAILPNYELIDRYDLQIFDEYYLQISHNLICLPGQTIQHIHMVRSHPMALLQCKKFFDAHEQISLVDDVDTATVAKRIAEEHLKGVGAIASLTAAEIYGLQVIATNIQTVENNFTRFILLKKDKETVASIPNKASLKITIVNEKGSLAKLLNLMCEYDLDLSKIQSIPVIEKPWNYAFFIDAQFEAYPKYQEALAKIKEEGHEIKVFGEYQSGK